MLYYFFAFIALFLIELLYFWVARTFNIVDNPNHRSSHSKPVLLGGGVIFYLAVLLFAVTHAWGEYAFLISLTLLAVVSYYDDLRPTYGWIRLLVQIAAVVVAFYGYLVDLEHWKSVLVVLVFVGIVNVYNFMDGINGMLVSNGLVTVGTFALVAAFSIPFLRLDFLLTVAIALLVFAFFNFRRSARCFSGDVGSIVLGLIVLYMLVNFVYGTSSNGLAVSYLTFLLVFLADGGLTVLKRFLCGRNIFQPHREHMYETLVNDLKVPHLRVSAGYALVQAAINGGYFLVADKNLYCFLCAVALILTYGLFFFFFNRKKEHGQQPDD